MTRRHFIQQSLTAVPAFSTWQAWAADDKWGASKGYPTGWGGQLERQAEYRVGNYSGGYEAIFPHRVMAPANSPVNWDVALVKDFKYRWGLFGKTPDEYLDAWPVTGLLICRDSTIFSEHYRHQRTAEMRLTSWSMAKSVTSLLLGICLDQKLIRSYDDTAETYVPELRGTLHGGITLRNLSNMSSGADIQHQRDNAQIYPAAFLSRTADIAKTVAAWDRRKEEQGRTYNYNELCPLTLGMVIRKVTSSSLSEFAQRVLWQPMGAGSKATWSTDSFKNEFNCIGFAATLRDWARLGTLVARRGRTESGVQVVSSSWIDEITHWGADDKQVRFGVASPRFGYKAHMWHNKADGSRLYFNGHHGQRVIIDMPTRTVLVHTAVEHDGNWQAELFAMFEAAVQL